MYFQPKLWLAARLRSSAQCGSAPHVRSNEAVSIQWLILVGVWLMVSSIPPTPMEYGVVTGMAEPYASEKACLHELHKSVNTKFNCKKEAGNDTQRNAICGAANSQLQDIVRKMHPICLPQETFLQKYNIIQTGESKEDPNGPPVYFVAPK